MLRELPLLAPNLTALNAHQISCEWKTLRDLLTKLPGLQSLDVHDSVIRSDARGGQRFDATPCGHEPEAHARWRALGTTSPPESFFDGAAILAERPLVDGHAA